MFFDIKYLRLLVKASLLNANKPKLISNDLESIKSTARVNKCILEFFHSAEIEGPYHHTLQVLAA